MDKKALNPNLFVALDMPTDFSIIIGDQFSRKFYFVYNGTDNQYNSKLYGNPETTGVANTGLVHEANGSFSVEIYGRPKLTGKNSMILKLENRTEYAIFEITFHVDGLKFLDYSLPDAIGIFKEYSARIHFYNPSKLKPKFMYDFPVEFGQVNTNFPDGIDFTTISFTPSKPRKYKFIVTALSGEEIELGRKTLHLEVVDARKMENANNFFGAKSVDIKNRK